MAEDDDKTEIPNDEAQNELITLSKENEEEFKIKIIKIMQDNSDKFNILKINNDNDEENTTMTKESFVNKFDATFKTELLNIIFDKIDTNSVGSITNAALINFINNKTKHPRKQTTQIVEIIYENIIRIIYIANYR